MPGEDHLTLQKRDLAEQSVSRGAEPPILAPAPAFQPARLLPMPLSAAHVLQLQRTLGNRATRRLLQRRPLAEASLVPQPPAPGPVLQRLPTRATLVAKAGNPHQDVKIRTLVLRAMSTKYKAVLAALDSYHTQAQQLWAAGNPADKIKADLTAALTVLTNACNIYLAGHTKSTDRRAPYVRELLEQHIPSEQDHINTLARDPSYAGYAGQTFDTAKTTAMQADTKPARLQQIGLAVSDIDCGHNMHISAIIDAGHHPVGESNPIPNTVYGVTLEYWERIEIDYDFETDDPSLVAALKASQTGENLKQWNDIYALAPGALTFQKVAGGLSWTQAVADAAQGKLSGSVNVGFVDSPAFKARQNRYGKRVLRFRIVFRDSYGTAKEILASQVIELAGGTTPVLQSFDDTAGNSINKFGAAVVPHGNTPQVLAQDVPQAATDELPTFLKLLKDAKATPFTNSELDQLVQQGLDGEGLKEYYKNLGRKSASGVELAGVNTVPYPQSGQQYYQLTLMNGGLLVALMQGDRIVKMYYTDNNQPTIKQRLDLPGRGWTDVDIRARSFAELPVEQVQAQYATIS